MPLTAGRQWVARVPRFVKDRPFTLIAVAAMVVLGLATGTFWNRLRDGSLYHVVPYGVPAFAAGRWWTPFTGSPFGLTPGQAGAMIVVFLVLVGFAEPRLGTRRTALITCAIQVGVVSAAAGLLALLRLTGWAWASELAKVLGAGFAAGAIGVACAATATLRAPWRGRVRAAFVLYAILVLLYAGRLGDLEHALAVLAGLTVGPLCVGRSPQVHKPRMSRHEWRLAAAALFAVAAATRLIVLLTPGAGSPLGVNDKAGADAFTVVIGIVVPLLLAEGLRRGRRLAWRIAVIYTGIAAAVVLLLIVAIIAVLATGSGGVTITGGSLSSAVADVVLWLAQFGVLILGRRAFRGTPWRDRRRRARTGESDRDAARRILHEVGGGRLAWMTTWPGNSWFFVDGVPGYVCYQAHSGVAVVLGDPVAPDQVTRADLADAFVDATEQAGMRACFFSATGETANWGALRGWQSVEVAVEAVIDLPALEFKGKAWQDVRTALNRAGKDGISFQLGKLSEMPHGVLSQVRAISEQWMGDKGLPEMGFTLGGVDEALDPEVLVGIAIDASGTVHGVTSWLPAYGPGGTTPGWTLDVMRRLPDGFRPVMEFLIASACLALRERGAQFVSLSGAPLAGDPRAEAGGVDRLLAWLGEQMEPLYGFRSLEKFKAKFFPRNESLYLVYGDEAALPAIGIAITRAYMADTTMFDLAAAGVRALQH